MIWRQGDMIFSAWRDLTLSQMNSATSKTPDSLKSCYENLLICDDKWRSGIRGVVVWQFRRVSGWNSPNLKNPPVCRISQKNGIFRFLSLGTQILSGVFCKLWLIFCSKIVRRSRVATFKEELSKLCSSKIEGIARKLCDSRHVWWRTKFEWWTFTA